MTNSSTAPSPHQEQGNPWRESLEQRLRERMRELIAQVLEEEVEDALGAQRSQRAAGGRLPGLAEARPGRRTDRVSLPGCDLPEGAQRGKSRFAARAGGAGGARRRGEGAAELGHGRGGAHGSMGGAVGESGGAEDGPAAAGDYRRQRGVGRSAGACVAGGRAAALHGAQADEPGEQSAAAQPRGATRGLST